MQKSKTIFIFKNKMFFPLKTGYIFLVFVLLFSVGILIGSVTSSRFDLISKFAEKEMLNFCTNHSNGEFLPAFLYSLKFWVPFYLAVFIFGTSFTGCLIVPVFTVYKGFCYGVITGAVYGKFALNGIVYTLLLIIPSMLVSAMGLIFLSGIAFRLSKLLFKGILPNGSLTSIYPKFTEYLKYTVILLILVLSASSFDGVTTAAFSKIVVL